MVTATPVGEDSWLAYLDEIVRKASDLETRVNAVEVYKRAVSAEPASLRLWLGYCNYFWSLWSDCQSPAPPEGWSEEELLMGRELFSFAAALELWQQGYEAVRYRINDSHQLWDRWISLELELLARTRTTGGIKRITHLYRNRLRTPHVAWDETSQAFSSFLSEYNRDAWEGAMKDVTVEAQQAKRIISARDPFELKINKASKTGDVEAEKSLMLEYLDWETRQSRRRGGSDTGDPETAVALCRGLYARALTGLFATDQDVWLDYIVYLSSSQPELTAASTSELFDALRRAVQHCPSSGELWSRYILCAEEAKLPFDEIEPIKHAATSEDQLYKNGMEAMLDMYVAWCGYLKRAAIGAGAGDEAADVADVGLPAALEDVAVVGKRLYGNNFQGDPEFRLERIYIQYLTEMKGAVDDARAQWNKLASAQIYADNHSFWLTYYTWEMLVFSSRSGKRRSPTPTSVAAEPRVPSSATSVLTRALSRTNLDWPEKVLEVFVQHCRDHETPASVRQAADKAYRVTKAIRTRRELEQKEKEEAYAAYYSQQQPEQGQQGKQPEATDNPATSEYKRKRGEHQGGDEAMPESASKRQRNDTAEPKSAAVDPQQQAEAKRDRENTTVIVENLPGNVTQTKLRQYFKDYGHINNITALVHDEKTQASTALIEFRTPQEAQSALLRDGKYFDQSQLKVVLGHDLTVYVTNYPPAADAKYIRDLFQDCGEVLSIRWPSLKVNTHRRFCYVSFRDRAAARAATGKDGELLEDRYRLVAKFSDPGRKKGREGALAEGREVHITNLDRTLHETELRDVFAKYGNVTRVNIPQTLGGKNRGFAFVDFSTSDEAQAAVAGLNNTKLRSQIMAVELSKESKVKASAKTIVNRELSGSPAPSSNMDVDGQDASGNKPTSTDISARTIALMGLPDTVNDARVRALVEPLGTIVQFVLQPIHGAVKIEFADAATAGKASLQLDGMDFEGYKLRTGSVDELRRAKAGNGQQNQQYQQQKPQRPAALAPPPSYIRRPGAPRGGGPKRGLGFASARKPAADKGTHDDATNGRPAPKSNADFKAMFLAPRAEQKTEDDK
ncbi:squamous cell carcinoma antigen recognized by T-cells 3 [Geosmithia morbida]|uniref:U4/U6 snRNA-associated-splicing factor PRP24 n=1 Tax=Geosmithia morbida TaxID=1094350 RepID=A0A9P5D2P1_9HYPO|nr:squamous cell carcinoma antigen recognized by T-cells 3 [Geosmithia morbida]KAF4121010.1 squamous cell carcinoma antigen recognized by T-cells 3 [Geosmithia morbida]